MQIIRVALPDETAAKLTELADAEYRGPRQQAAVLLIEAVNRATDSMHRPRRDLASAGARP